MNTTDPIIPGVSVAGVRIGDPIQEILSSSPPHSVEGLHGTRMYVFDAVTIWVSEHCVDQIGIRAPYTGKVSSEVGIGSTIADVQRVFGPVSEDDDDNLVVVGFPGWCFETERWLGGRTLESNAEARLSEIFVFAPRT